jgi:hypothetical protein
MPTEPSPKHRSPSQLRKAAQAAAAVANAVEQDRLAIAAGTIELGLTERRRLVRPLPAPHAVEVQSDVDWAIFQTLISDNQKL